MLTVNDIRVGSIIEKREWSGEVVRVRITGVYEDVKNGRPGFDGRFVGSSARSYGTWGYEDQIVSVETF